MLFLYDTVNQMGAEAIERLVVAEAVRSVLLRLLSAILSGRVFLTATS